MPDYIGLKLGNYHIVRLIGRGGFANVYQGEHIYLKKPAAIKILNMQLMNDALEKFLQEARIIALLEHPHIVRILEFGVEDITPFLVMNYANNGTLRQRYPRKSTLSWANILSYTKQVADALQYAHDNGVIHRDVKPENMLLDKNQQVQLSDFGLAVLAQNMNVLTASSAGTTAYMAPEQLQGQPCRASDQYALGIVVYEWLCGSRPFSGPEREMTIQHLYSSPPSLRTKRPDVSPALEQVIMKALAKDPQARFATVQEFAQALEHASASETLRDTEEERITSPTHSLYEQAEPVSSQGSTHTLAPRMNMSSPSNSLPQLPLLVYESSLTNNGRILQPSLGPSIHSLEGSPLPIPSSSEGEISYTSHTSAVSLSAPPPTLQPFPDLAASAFLHTTPGAEEKIAPSLPLLPAQSSTSRQQPIARHATRTTVIGVAILGLILLASMFLWTQFAPNKLKTLTHLTVLPNPAHTPVTSSTRTLHQPSSTPTTHPSTGNIPATTPQSGALPGTPPLPGTQPTPIPTIGTQPTPIPPPAITPTPTPTIPLTVDFVNPPPTAVGGTTITIVTQASKGGVTIALNGKVRSFGQVTADSQGIASFQVNVPLKAKRMFLTATAIDGNGDQVQSPQTIIVVEANGN